MSYTISGTLRGTEKRYAAVLFDHITYKRDRKQRNEDEFNKRTTATTHAVNSQKRFVGNFAENGAWRATVLRAVRWEM